MARWIGRLAWVALFSFFALAGGCDAVVYQPDGLTDTVPVYLLKYNVHSSVVMPYDGNYIEYSFGDWNYAALHHKFINDALGALFISGDSAFERRIIEADPHTGEPILRDNPALVVRLYADRKACEERLRDLDERFQRDLTIHRKDGLVIYADRGEVFVKDPEHYSLTNNCNHLTAATLEALGFRVDGLVLTNQFHLAD